MKKLVRRLLLMISMMICLMTQFIHAFESQTFGTFSGLINHLKIEKNQLVRLELIPTKEEAGSIKLQGILTLYFGGFDSGEYLSAHFNDVYFNILTGVMTFNQTDREVYIKNAVVKDNIFSGILYSTSGEIGPIILSKKNDLIPTRPLIEPINGEYNGKCGNDLGKLQLVTFRSSNDKARLGNPFGTYEVKGQLGKMDGGLCYGETKKYCTYSKIKSSTYDFISGSLILVGNPKTYTCKVDGSKINCGECQFERVSDEMKNPKVNLQLKAHDPFNWFKFKKSDDRNLNSISGLYNGYLYHDNLNMYQKVEIEISTFQKPTLNGVSLYISAIARLQFGNSKEEILKYKFDSIEFPNPLIKPQFILSRKEGVDSDALIHITEIKDGTLKGNWFSEVFGKIGPFVVTKNNNLPALDNPNLLINQISSIYEESGDYELHRDLILDFFVSSDRLSINYSNPFYPLNINGWVWRKSGITVKENISQSSYDFYTGRIAVVYGNEHVVTGFVNSNRQIRFRTLMGGFGTYMQSFDLIPYAKKEK